MITFQKSLELDEAFRNLVKSFMTMDKYMDRMKEFHDEIITPKMEKEILEMYAQLNLPIPTLQYDAKILKENPYFKNIKLDNINYQSVKCEVARIKKHQLIAMDFTHKVGKYLMFQRPMGYFNENIYLPVLKQGKKVWMSPSVSEINSMDKGIQSGHGKCLTFGLGLGIITYLWLLRPEVESVTVVEYNPDVIHLFKEYILPQFNIDKKVEIIEGNAFGYYNDDFLEQFNYAYVDFWESNSDGLDAYIKLMEKEVKYEHVDYWIEESILYDVKTTLLPYLYSLYTGKGVHHFLSNTKGATHRVAIKANRYFKSLEQTITTEEELLNFFHDKEILREILRR